MLLFAQREVMSSGYPVHGALEVVDEDSLEVVPRVDGVGFQALEPCERSWLQGYREVESLRDRISSCNIDGSPV